MNSTARAQAWSSLAAVAALPLLYIGGTHRMAALSVAGLTVFAASMLISPALRYVSRPRA
ncbi:hypothetical protein ACWEQ7_36940 [Streptomyces sp. NPDC004069]|uniref:hypothetical protein n=1 Tax=Streptomyces sp. NPDC052043 TaxID=3365684 RepID=UPI0037D6F016